jgi:hypothetical protein
MSNVAGRLMISNYKINTWPKLIFLSERKLFIFWTRNENCPASFYNTIDSKLRFNNKKYISLDVSDAFKNTGAIGII